MLLKFPENEFKMPTPRLSKQEIDIGRIYLDENNPRHEIYKSQEEVINFLCSSEEILNLAKDIVENGLSPLGVFGLILEEGSSKKDKVKNYIVVEGNRRICALKLLNDPELAPSDQKSIHQAFKRMGLHTLGHINSFPE